MDEVSYHYEVNRMMASLDDVCVPADAAFIRKVVVVLALLCIALPTHATVLFSQPVSNTDTNINQTTAWKTSGTSQGLNLRCGSVRHTFRDS